MSYDTSLRISTGNGDSLDLDLGNYTYNCSEMLAKATKGKFGLSTLSGMNALEVANILDEAIKEMRNNKEKSAAMNPKNGWGDYDGWLTYLENIAKACRIHPKTILNVC